jgi:tetratricopeptide (TPR) repeat protein
MRIALLQSGMSPMGHEDWYRRTSWNAHDKEEFFARLKRSRKLFNAAQYLRIQALYLERLGTRKMLKAALDLLELLLTEYKSEFDLASAYLQKASCFNKLDRVEEAEAAYRAALYAMRSYSGVKTTAHLEFGLFAVRRNLSGLYDDALAALEEFRLPHMFPQQVYDEATIRAHVAAERGDLEQATSFAQLALEAANRQSSGLTYHPQAGLVTDVDPKLHRRLKKLVSAEQSK